MLEQVESLAYITMDGPAAEKRDDEFRERTAAGQDALMPYHDETGTAQMWDEHREVFGYDAEDAGDQWWVDWGLPAERARGIDLSADIELGTTVTDE